MSAQLIAQIHDLLEAYLRGEIDQTTLEERFVPATWNVDLGDGSEIAMIVRQVLVALDERKDGEITESMFKSMVRNVFDEVNVSAG